MASLLCPSYASVPGALLLGRLADDGTMGLLKSPIPVTAEFLEAIHSPERDVDSAWRFAGPCMQSACSRWESGGCQVAKQAVALPLPDGATETLPECGIREACRWFNQQGRAACAACVFVVRRTEAA